MGKNKKRYDVQSKNRASLRCLLRVAVAAYLGYTGYQITPLNSPSQQLDPKIAWAAGAFFVVAALVVAAYALRQYGKELAAAEIAEEDSSEAAIVEPAGGAEEDSCGS